MLIVSFRPLFFLVSLGEIWPYFSVLICFELISGSWRVYDNGGPGRVLYESSAPSLTSSSEGRLYSWMLIKLRFCIKMVICNFRFFNTLWQLDRKSVV